MRPVAHRNASARLGVQPGMTGRKLVMLAMAAMGVMGAVPTVASLVAENQPASAEATPSPSPRASEAVVAPAMGDIAWVYAPPPGAGMAVDAYGLQAGTLDVDRPLVDLEVEIPPAPFRPPPGWGTQG